MKKIFIFIFFFALTIFCNAAEDKVVVYGSSDQKTKELKDFLDEFKIKYTFYSIAQLSEKLYAIITKENKNFYLPVVDVNGKIFISNPELYNQIKANLFNKYEAVDNDKNSSEINYSLENIPKYETKTININSQNGFLYLSLKTIDGIGCWIKVYNSKKEILTSAFAFPDDKISITNYKICAMERSKNIVNILIRFPDSDNYICEVLSEIEPNSNSYVQKIKYMATSKTGMDEKDFFENICEYALKNNAHKITEGILNHFEKVLKQDEKGKEIFLESAEKGKTGTVEYLLGNSSLIKNFFIDQFSTDGMTALMLAAKNGHFEIVKMLLEKKADTEVLSDDGKAALQYAKENNHPDIAAILGKIIIPKPAIAYKKLIGDWIGSYQYYDEVFYLELNIFQENNQLKGKGIVNAGLNKNEIEKAYQNKLAVSELELNSGYNEKYNAYIYTTLGCRFVAEEKFNIQIMDKDIIINNRNTKVIGTKNKNINSSFGRNDPVELSLNGRLNDNGMITGYTNKLEENSFFYLMRKEYSKKIIPFNLEKGKTMKVECKDFSNFHYNCYIPKKYDPSIPMPIIIFDNPNGNAAPLQTKTAEEVGFISIGLVESGNEITKSEECCFAVILDMKKRFNIKGIIFAGFSGGATRSDVRASYYLDLSKGAIEIGGGSYYAYNAGIPVFRIEGEKDEITNMSKQSLDSLKKNNDKIKEKNDKLYNYGIHPGGHEWYVPKLLDEAIIWLLNL